MHFRNRKFNYSFHFECCITVCNVCVLVQGRVIEIIIPCVQCKRSKQIRVRNNSVIIMSLSGGYWGIRVGRDIF